MPRKDPRANYGGYFGGTRGVRGNDRLPPDRIEKIPKDQTTFGPWGVPNYPEPQPINVMPYQNAGYRDDYNSKGQRAVYGNDYLPDPGYSSAETFLKDIDTVFINPQYKVEYLTQGTMDTREYHMNRMMAIDAGLKEFARANSAYFGKNFQVMPIPLKEGRYEPVTNANRTLQLNIMGEADMSDAPRAGAAYRSPFHPADAKNRRPYIKNFTVNTAAKNRFDAYLEDPKFRAHVNQHEFGHTLGFGHPEPIENNPNTLMSYDQRAQNYGAKLMPADINYWKDQYKKLADKRKPSNYTTYDKKKK